MAKKRKMKFDIEMRKLSKAVLKGSYGKCSPSDPACVAGCPGPLAA